MKIVFISNLFPRPDQPQRGMFNRQLVEALASRASVEVIVPTPGRAAMSMEQGAVSQSDLCCDVQYVPVPHVPLLGRNIASWLHARALRRLKSKLLSADVVLASWLYPDACAAVGICVELGIPVWIQVLGSDIYHLKSRTRRSIILDACSRAAGIICVAQHLKDALVNAGVDEGKVHVVPNGVDGKLFHSREWGSLTKDTEAQRGGEDVSRPAPPPREPHPSLIQSYGGQAEHAEVERRRSDADLAEEASSGRAAQRNGVKISDNPVHPVKNSSTEVLWVGNLVDVKDPDLMLDVWERLQQHDAVSPSGLRSPVSGFPLTRLRLVMIGDGPRRDHLERKAEEMGMANTIDFLGQLPHEEVARRMACARMLCLTSRSEGMPNVILEALASGLPVVATDVGAVKAMLKDCEACRVVARGSALVDRFAGAVTEVADINVARSASLVKRLLRSWDDMADDILALMLADAKLTSADVV